MANVLIEESTMSNIANAIRSKTGKSDLILAKNMPSEIESIESGGSDDLFNALVDDSITGKVTINVINARKYALAYVANITEIEALNLKTISESVFYSCSARKVVLTNPDIGNLAFALSNITTLVLKGSKVANLLGTRVFVTTPIEKKTGYIYVPRNLIEQYKTATNWVTYATQFRAIEDYP
ncbi:hypothetical protein ACQPUY_17710, partial [Clostridium nigeriense]|uniref:hypothetical protein n=1 Tax=Clostridium nigeriense TaxID=1805470 RepID=UPI003D344D43